MSTGSTSDSAEPPSEPEPPFTGARRHFWLASPGRHPVTWALAGVVLLTSGGVALIQHQPGARARAQSVYCGLVTCAVLRSVADSSSAAVAAPRLSPALPSSGAPSRAPVRTRTSRPTRTSTPTPTPTPARSRPPKPVAPSKPCAPSPKPTAAPTPAPSPTPPPSPTRPTRWPWPPTWGWPGGGWPGGGGGGGRHAQVASTWQRGYQPRHAHHL